MGQIVSFRVFVCTVFWRASGVPRTFYKGLPSDLVRLIVAYWIESVAQQSDKTLIVAVNYLDHYIRLFQMLCFPFSDHVMLPHIPVYFKFRPVYEHMIMNKELKPCANGRKIVVELLLGVAGEQCCVHLHWIARGLKRHKFKLSWEHQVAWIGGKRTYKPKRLITDIYSPAMGLPAAAAIE